MQTNKLHIVSFDVPYPADYGGAIDVFYKIKALSEAGADIYLHCFQYGRAVSDELSKLCKEVWYYPRKTGMSGISYKIPYIVYSRRDEILLKRLQAIDAPILFEGVHSTYYLSHPSLQNRIKAIRTHNIEAHYYKQLANRQTPITKRIYYKAEAALLRKYEEHLYAANIFLPLSMEDEKHFSSLYPAAIHKFTAPFHPYSEVESKIGKGNYCLYHGNLSHPENIEAVLFLINEVFANTTLLFTITGKNPAKEIVDAAKQLSNCTLVGNPDDKTINDLINNAHIHVLPTFQASGMKLKLLYALFNGRHVLVNEKMLHGTGLSELCATANDAVSFKTEIIRLMETAFTLNDITKRDTNLAINYNNKTNAERILTLLRE